MWEKYTLYASNVSHADNGWETKLGQTFYKGVFDRVCQANDTKGCVSTMAVIGAYFGHQSDSASPLHLSEAVIDFARIKMTF